MPILTFLEPGDLTDGTVRLVEPSKAGIPAMLKTIDDLRCAGDPCRYWTRASLKSFVGYAPRGRERAGGVMVASYHFWVFVRPTAQRPLQACGTISFRLGDDDETRQYMGHVGYTIFPPARGYRLAERATRLLLPLATRHGFDTLWITTGPENIASRKTCERLGAELVDTVTVPDGHPLRSRGEMLKCRYRLTLGDTGASPKSDNAVDAAR